MGVRREMSRIADLAHLRLSEAELNVTAGYIEAAVGSLSPVDTSGADELHPDGTQSSRGERHDAAGAEPLLEPIERLAPAWRAGFFTVPKHSGG